MFEKLFRKDMTGPAHAGKADEGTPGPPSELEASSTGAHSPAGIAADESQAWRDRITAAQSDDGALLQLAHQAPGVELKLAALQALSHEDSFKQAMREFRDQDKRLYRAAKTRWQDASGRREADTESRALIASAHALLEQDSVPANRLVELDRAWGELRAEWLDPALPVEFAALREQLGTRVRARGEGEQAITRWLAAANMAIEQLRASLAGVAQGDDPPAASESLAAALLELLGGCPDASDSRCIDKSDAARRALALAFSVVQRAQLLQSLPAIGAVDEADEKTRIEEWRGFPEVPEAELQSVLALRFADWRNAGTQQRQREDDARRAHEQEASAEQKKLRLTTLQRDVEAAEAAHAAGHVADLTRLMAAIEQSLKAGRVSAPLTERIKSLRREESRLRGWQRWGGGQRREELVAEAQALAEASAGKVAVKGHAEAIDKLRERWKDLDKLGGATNQALWLAFDGALKAAYAPVAAHLDKLKVARNENLAARIKIVDGLVHAAEKFFPAAHASVTAPDVGAQAVASIQAEPEVSASGANAGVTPVSSSQEYATAPAREDTASSFPIAEDAESVATVQEIPVPAPAVPESAAPAQALNDSAHAASALQDAPSAAATGEGGIPARGGHEHGPSRSRGQEGTVQPGVNVRDAAPDWRVIARTLEDAHVAWRKLGPVEHTVPRKAQKGDNAVTTRYTQAVQRLEAPLKQAYTEATQQREQLIAAAKQLAEVDAAARDSIDRVRRLQAQWQASAKSLVLPRHEENRLWAAFKAATDAVFTGRDAARAAKESESSAQIKAREEIIERLSALSPTCTGPEIKRAMAEAETAWRAARSVPKPQSIQLDARYRAARDAATKRMAEAATHAAQARFDALIAAMALCEEREAAADAGPGAGDAADIEARWNAIGDLPDAWKPRIEARFRGDGAAVTQADSKTAGSADGLRDALLNLEIASGIDSPPEFRGDRQQLKLRALKNAMEGRQTAVTTPADIERWLLDAAATPRPDVVSRERLAKVIAAVRRRPG